VILEEVANELEACKLKLNDKTLLFVLTCRSRRYCKRELVVH